jgi:hypothetical protein
MLDVYGQESITNLKMNYVYDCDQGSLTRGEDSVLLTYLVLTSLDHLLFKLKILLNFCTQQASLLRRSIVLSLPPQLVFPVVNPPSSSSKESCDSCDKSRADSFLRFNSLSPQRGRVCRQKVDQLDKNYEKRASLL